MTTIEKIWEYIDHDESFTIALSDGRKFLVKNRHWIGAHPSRKSSAVTVYGPGDEEEHFIPLLAITSVSRNDSGNGGALPPLN
jgi:hypothetical protein